MRRSGQIAKLSWPAGMISRFKRNSDGATAVEFALVITPFLMFIFGLIAVSLYFFMMTSVENGMDQTSRLIRTGQAKSEQVHPGNNPTNNPDNPDGLMTANDFKQKICDTAGYWIKCNSLQVFVTRFNSWQAVQPQPCVDANQVVITNNSPGGQPIAVSAGSANEIVLVTSCYKWDLPASIPYVDFGNMPDKSLMMQSTTAFKVEPHDKD